MKLSPAFVLAFAAYTSVNPLAQKRANTSDAATIGYATGTTGGGSASLVTVSTLAELNLTCTHTYNNYFVGNNDGINTRVGAELLVENNVFEKVGKPLYSTDNGFANASGNDFRGAESTAETTTWKAVGYSYSLSTVGSVKASVNANAGAKLSF